MSTLGAAVTQMRTLRPRERRDWPRGSWMGDLLPPSGLDSAHQALGLVKAYRVWGWGCVVLVLMAAGRGGSVAETVWGWARGPAAGHLVNGLGQTEGEVAAEAWVVSG